MKEFNPDSESITAYLERTTVYCAANDITEEKQASVLLTAIGPQTYSLLRSLKAPDLPATKTYAQLSTLLRTHYDPKPLVIAERFHFHRRNQRPDESIAAFVAEIHRLSTHCPFEGTLEACTGDGGDGQEF